MRDYERLAFQHGPDATLILADRVILRASLRVEAVFGWSPRELEGQSIRVLYPTETDYELIGDRARRAMQASAIYRDERFMRRKDGQVVWMEGHGATLDAEVSGERLHVQGKRPGAGLIAADGRGPPGEHDPQDGGQEQFRAGPAAFVGGRGRVEPGFFFSGRGGNCGAPPAWGKSGTSGR